MSKKLQKRLESLPMQHRAAKVASFDYDKRTVTFALTSESPVERWYGNEVLSHDAAAIDTNRLGRGVAMLFNHDRNQQIGRIEGHEVKDGKLYVTARFGNSALATEKLNDVRDGILVDASAGYIPHDYEYKEGRSGQPDTITWTRWEPVEGSLVTIPADPTVGIGRSLDDDKGPKFPVRCLKRDADDDDEDCGCNCSACEDGNHADCTTQDCTYGDGNRGASKVKTPAPAETKEERMTEEEKRAAEAALRTAERTAERERISEIHALAREHGDHFTRDAAEKAINDGATVDAVRTLILKNQREASKAGAVRSGAADQGTGGESPKSGVEFVRDAGDKVEKGIRVARSLRCMAKAKGDLGKAGAFAREIGDQVLERSFAAAASSASDGGYALQGSYSAEIIELLRPVAVVRSMGATSVPMDGTYTQNRLLGGGSVTWVGENQDIPASKGKFGQLKLSAKKLAGLLPISNDLLRRSGGEAADMAVRDDLQIVLANAEDISFIRSQGSQYSPKGLRYWCLPANVFQGTNVTGLTAAALIQAVIADISKLKLALTKANVRFIRPGIIMSPSTEYFFYNLLDGLGHFVFRDEMDGGKFQKYPYKVSNLLPENLTYGSGANQVTGATELYFADFADVTIGDAPQIGIEFSTEASYIDPTSGSLVSAFSQDQTVMRVIKEVDLGMRHPESIAVLQLAYYNQAQG